MAQNNKNNKKLIIREIITWGIMLVLLFAISRIFTSSKTPQAQTVPYSEFISDIKNEEMQSVIIKMQDTSPSGVIGVLKNGQSIQANTPGDVNLLITLLTDKNITFSVQRSNSTFWSIFWSIVPWVLIIGFWWFIMQRMMQGAGGGANQAFKFGKSQAKLFVDTKPKITFKDVAGAEEVKEEVKEIIEFLKNPKKFSKYGAKMPK